MAEKEERISVIVYEKDPCENCPGNPMTDCQVCEKDLRYDGAMTRTEAINRMAKALFKVDNVLALDIEFEQLTKQKQLTYKVFAEAELNALLEGDK